MSEPIRLWWEPGGRTALTRSARPVRRFDRAFRRRAEELAARMEAIPDAAGLAANQLGWSAAVFAADLDGSGDPTLCVNPTLSPVGEVQLLVATEGCLSVPGFYGVVARPQSLSLRYQDLAGTPHTRIVHGFYARLVEHECDHLGGVVYLRRLLAPALVRALDGQEYPLQGLELPADSLLPPTTPLLIP